MWLEEPQVTRASILIARGIIDDLRSSVQVLDSLEEIAVRTHNTRYKIIILALRSLALDALGQPGEADDVLKEAINLAQLGGDIRAFTDQGRPMKTLLTRLLEQGHSREMIHRIVEAFPEGDKKFIPAQSAPPLSIVQPSGGLTLIEPLTPRELEILKLLRGPSSIKEIALQLNISYETVRRHIANIYGKLGVNQRWDAIARAEELNILLLR
jgi:LuxR family transcriptional regulator, maltose regulon positive regulatory protein